MTATIIDGKKIAEQINRATARRVKILKKRGVTPKLAIVLVGDDLPSQTYIRKKQEAAARVGIDSALYKFPTTISRPDLIAQLLKIQKDKKLTGLIVQLPLPEKLYSPEVLNTIAPEIDVDCMTNDNLGRLVMQTNFLLPPTPGAVMTILEKLKIKLPGKNVTIVGMGALVGKPLAIIMANADASVSTCCAHTSDTATKCRAADIIVSGVGKKDLIRGNMIKPGAVVIDTGVSFVHNKMYGDVNMAEVVKKAGHLTPTPGGVGPITVSLLLRNTLICAERKIYARKNNRRN